MRYLPTPGCTSEALELLVSGMDDTDACYVWRGQGNIHWEPLPGLYRRLINNGFDYSEIDEGLVAKYETDLLCDSNGLGFYGEAGGNRLDLMCNLQHAGGATRLLDVTSDPWVALWFACNDISDEDAVVFRYAIGSDYFAEAKAVFTWDDITSPCLTGKPVLYSPRKINERIKAQSSLFLSTVLEGTLASPTIFTETTPSSNVTALRIPRSLVDEMRNMLAKSHMMRYYQLFPDFDGYAKFNSARSEFHRSPDNLFSGSEGIFPDTFNPHFA